MILKSESTMGEIPTSIYGKCVMTFDMAKVLESKKKYRAKMAALPIAEKLRILDDLRERTVAIRSATLKTDCAISGEPSKFNLGDETDEL